MKAQFDQALDADVLLIPFEDSGLEPHQVVKDAYQVANDYALELFPYDINAARDYFRTRILSVALLLQNYTGRRG